MLLETQWTEKKKSEKSEKIIIYSWRAALRQTSAHKGDNSTDGDNGTDSDNGHPPKEHTHLLL